MQSLKLIGVTKWLWFMVHLYEILFFQNLIMKVAARTILSI